MDVVKHNTLTDSCNTAPGLLEVLSHCLPLICVASTAVSKALVRFLLSAHFFMSAVKMYCCYEPNDAPS